MRPTRAIRGLADMPAAPGHGSDHQLTSDPSVAEGSAQPMSDRRIVNEAMNGVRRDRNPGISKR